MKLDSVKRISKEDMSQKGDVPGWVDPMLDTLNDFIEKTTKLLNGNQSFKDNFLCKEHTQDFASGTAYTVNPALDGRGKFKVYGVVPLDTNGATITGFLWQKLDNGNVSVTFTFSAATTNKCTILLLLR